MLGVAFNDTLPFASANLSIDLAMYLLHKIVFVAFVVKKITTASFAGKDGFSVWVKTATNFGIHEHGVAVRTERPSVCGVAGYV